MIQKFCLICKTTDRVLVRDHCHKSGYCRGILCDRCNSWIGILENTPSVLDTLTVDNCTDSYKLWIVQYHGEIIKHLNRKTTFPFTKKRFSTKKMQALIHATADRHDLKQFRIREEVTQ